MTTCTDPSVLPARVDWTGDNPFIYLSGDGGEENWATLALFFRVTLSEHGSGCMALVLEAPYDPPGSEASRLCVTDNEPLARFLLDAFVSRFPLFRRAQYVRDLPIVADATCTPNGNGRSWHTESLRAQDGALTVELQWSGLSAPFAVIVPPERSATGGHEMLSVFSLASSARVSVNGRRLPGEVTERDFFGGRAPSAALALSETWLRPGRNEP